MSEQQILIIHKFEILFNILKELNNFFNFELISTNTLKIEEIIINKNFLIISGEKSARFTNQIIIKY